MCAEGLGRLSEHMETGLFTGCTIKKRLGVGVENANCVLGRLTCFRKYGHWGKLSSMIHLVFLSFFLEQQGKAFKVYDNQRRDPLMKKIQLWLNLSELRKTTFSRQAVTRSKLPFFPRTYCTIPARILRGWKFR